MSSEDFLRDLVRPRGRPAPGKPTAVDDAEEWMKEFGIDETALPAIEEPRSPSSKDEAPPAARPKREGESDSEYWLREFGFDEDPFKK
jgi:hypothetical protein